MITIDGSMGEGGGQVLRSSLALAMITGQTVTLGKIRAGRKKPGLMRQHLTCVRAAAEVSGATVDGAELNSQQLLFQPGSIRGGKFRFAVGTAGSATLVFQTVLPALLRAPEPSEVTLEGGTHNSKAPPYDFIERSFLPVLRRMGLTIDVSLQRHGFYPAGGGQFVAQVTPGALQPVSVVDCGPVVATRARVLASRMKKGVTSREVKVIKERLGWSDVRPHSVESNGPGNVVLLELERESLTEIVAGFGERGTPAEDVAWKACYEMSRLLESDVPVGEHLADQLLLPMAMAGGGELRTVDLSLHTETNMAVIQRFLPEVRFTVDRRGADDVHLKVTLA